jgi:hypothetical protein
MTMTEKETRKKLADSKKNIRRIREKWAIPEHAGVMSIFAILNSPKRGKKLDKVLETIIEEWIKNYKFIYNYNKSKKFAIKTITERAKKTNTILEGKTPCHMMNLPCPLIKYLYTNGDEHYEEWYVNNIALLSASRMAKILLWNKPSRLEGKNWKWSEEARAKVTYHRHSRWLEEAPLKGAINLFLVRPD